MTPVQTAAASALIFGIGLAAAGCQATQERTGMAGFQPSVAAVQPSEAADPGLIPSSGPSEGALVAQSDASEPDDAVPGTDVENAGREVEANLACPFSATAMRVHPFSRLRLRSGTGRPPIIEVRLEFFDQFGDTTKAIGQVRFELYESEQGDSDVPIPGRRIKMWQPAFDALAANDSYYDDITQTYVFRLDGSEIQQPIPNRLVLIATLQETVTMTRMVDQLELRTEP